MKHLLLTVVAALCLPLFLPQITQAQTVSCPPVEAGKGYTHNTVLKILVQDDYEELQPAGTQICIPTTRKNASVTMNDIYKQIDLLKIPIIPSGTRNNASLTKEEYYCSKWNTESTINQIVFTPFQTEGYHVCGAFDPQDRFGVNGTVDRRTLHRYILNRNNFTDVYIYVIDSVEATEETAQNQAPRSQAECEATKQSDERKCTTLFEAGVEDDEIANCLAFAQNSYTQCMAAVLNPTVDWKTLGGAPDGYSGPLPNCAFTNGGCRNINDVVEIGINIARMIFQFLGTIAFVMFVIGGAMMVFSAGNQDRFKQGTKVLAAAVIGVVIALTAFIGVEFLLDILNVSTDFRPTGI